MEKASVFLGTPTTRDLPLPYVKSLWTTKIEGNLAWDFVLGMAIDIGRNEIVKRFLKYKEYDYLLMHDSDASWHPGAIQRLVDRKLPVVTAVIYKRDIPTIPTIGKHVSISAEGAHMYSFTDTVNKLIDIGKREKFDVDTMKNELLLDMHDDDIQEVDGAGAHFMLIRRDVLEAIGENWYQCTRTNSGEDFDFCRKVQKAGYKLYCDYSVHTGHQFGSTRGIGLREFLLFSDKAKLETVWTA